MKRKARVTVTVDPALVRVAGRAVAAGRATSLSAWVNLALEERAEKERRLQALADAVAAYEAEFGVITDAEMAAQARADRRGTRGSGGSRRRAKVIRRGRAA
jgi:hypothetical protein